MKNVQFKFSLFVGIAINVLGALILQKDPAGFALLMVGAVLIFTAFLTKKTQQSIRLSIAHNTHKE